MAESSNCLSQAIQISDHLNAIKTLGELLELCREELDNPPENSLTRIGLLLDSYVSQVDYHFNELEALTNGLQTDLVQIRHKVAPVPFKAKMSNEQS